MSLIDIVAEMADDDRVRIHAVELKMRTEWGQQVELQTFACGLIIPRPGQLGGRRPQTQFPITIHTSAGDVNLQGVY